MISGNSWWKSSAETRIEQALARTGSVLGTMTATGATYEQVQDVKQRMEQANTEPDYILARRGERAA